MIVFFFFKEPQAWDKSRSSDEGGRGIRGQIIKIKKGNLGRLLHKESKTAEHRKVVLIKTCAFNGILRLFLKQFYNRLNHSIFGARCLNLINTSKGMLGPKASKIYATTSLAEREKYHLISTKNFTTKFSSTEKKFTQSNFQDIPLMALYFRWTGMSFCNLPKLWWRCYFISLIGVGPGLKPIIHS